MLIAGVSNAFLAGDLFNLYVGFEILLMASYVLLTLGGSAPRDPGRHHLRRGQPDQLADLPGRDRAGLRRDRHGQHGAAGRSGSASCPTGTQLLLQSMLLIAFCIKAAVFPLSAWLLVALIGLAGLLVLAVPLGLILLAVFALSGSEAVVIAVAIPLGIIALLVLIVAGLALQVVSQLATRELVLDGGRAVDSLKSGYTLARANLKTAILVGLLALAIGLVAAIVFVVGVLLVGLVLAIPAIILAISEMGSAAIVAGVVAGVILLPLFLAAAGALGTFQHSYWTLAYLRLRPPVTPVPTPA